MSEITLSVIASVLPLAVMMLQRYRLQTTTSPDGRFYEAMSKGQDAPRPYSLRPLLPLILRDEWHWEIVGIVSMLAVGALSYSIFRMSLSAELAVYAVAIVAVTPGITRINGRFPILVDAPALAFALASALFALQGNIWAAVATAAVGAFVSEKVPVFAALFAWSLYPLLGLLITAVLYVKSKDIKTGIDWLDKPFITAWQTHRSRVMNYRGSLATWGLLPIVMADFTLQSWVTLAVSYAQLIRSQDYGRLVSWAVIVIAPLAVSHAPSQFLAPLVVLHAYISDTDGSV